MKRIQLPLPLLLRSCLLVCLTVGFLLPSQAQFNRLRRKIEQKLEEKTVEKTEEVLIRKIEEAVNGIDSTGNSSNPTNEGTTQNPNTEIRTNENGEVIMVTEDEENQTNTTITLSEDEIPADLQPSSFIGSFAVVSAEYDSKGKAKDNGPITTKYFIEKYQFAIEPQTENEGEETYLILDRARRKIITKVNSSEGKKATILPMMKVDMQVENETLSNGNYEVKPTGRTDIIEGFPAEEYAVTSTEGSGTFWASEAVTFNMWEAFDFIKVKNNQSGGVMNYSEIFGVDGTVIKYDFTNNEGERNTFLLSDINEGAIDPAIFSLRGYQIMDLTRFQMKRN